MLLFFGFRLWWDLVGVGRWVLDEVRVGFGEVGVLGEAVGRFGVVGLGRVALYFLDQVQHLII